MIELLLALLLTISIEYLVVFFALICRRKELRGRVLRVVVGMNLITNPALNFLGFLGSVYLFDAFYGFDAFVILEVLVIFIESFILRKYLHMHFFWAFTLSLVSNVVSIVVGLVLADLINFISWYITTGGTLFSG